MAEDKTGPTKGDAENAKKVEQSTKRTAMSKKEIRQLAEETARLEKEQLTSLNETVSIQQDITDELAQQGKQHKLSNTVYKDSISLSKKVTKSIQESVHAGKNLDAIGRSLNKNANLQLSLESNIASIIKQEGVSVESMLKKESDLSKVKALSAKAAEEQKTLTEQNLNIENELASTIEEQEQAKRNLFYLGGDISKLTGEEKIAQEEKYKSLEEEIIELEKKEKLLHTQDNKSKSAIEDAKEKSKLLENHVLSIEETISPQERQAMLMQKSIENLAEANKKLQEQKDHQEAINKAMGLSGAALGAINKAFGGALGPVKELEQKSKEQISDLIEQRTLYDDLGNVIEKGMVSKMEGFGILLKNIGGGIVSNMLDPMTLLMAVFEFGKQTKELREGLAVSEHQANLLVGDMEQISNSFGDVAITGRKVQAAMLAINKQIGFGGTSTKAWAAETAVLMDKWGMTAEQAGNFAQSSIATGKSISSLKHEAIGAVVAIENANGVTLNLKDIMLEASSVTGEMRANFGGSIVEIAKGVAMAKSFGMELKDLASASSSLLDFESSISAELEAELLTGKQLNLERARAAALAGDMTTLAQELNKNVGTYSDFLSMNVLQRQAMAKAMGMEVGQMEEMLMKGSNLADQAKEARAAGNEDLAKQIEAKDTQQKFLDIVENIKAKFVTIVSGPLSQLVEQIAKIVEQTLLWMKPIFWVLGKISQLIVKSKVLGPILVGLWAFGKMKTYFAIAKAGFSGMLANIKAGYKGIVGLVGKMKGLGKGVGNIKFDPRMAGGGRFKDVGTGKMVSNKAAAAAGAKKTDLFKGVKPKDISKDATAATKGGAATGKSSKGMASGLKELANGLKAMGAGKVLKGILNLALAGPAFVLALPSIPFLIFMGLTPLKQLAINMKSLAMGLKALGGGKQLFGVGVLAALGAAGALALISIPFLGFVGLFGAGVAAGLVALGGGLASLGAVAATGMPFLAVGLIAALGVSLIPFGIALAFAGAAMWMFGKGIQAALEPIPPIIEAVAAAISTIIGALGDFFTTLGEVNWGSMLLAPLALGGLALGLLAMGYASLVASPGLIMLSFFGLPVLKGLADVAPSLEVASIAIERLAGQISVMSQIGEGFKEIASGINHMTLSLALLTPFLPTLAALSAFGLIGPVLESVIGGGGEGEGGGKGEGEKTTTVSLDEGTMTKLTAMMVEAVSNVTLNTEVSSDIWGAGNRNSNGSHQQKLKGSTALV